MTEPLYNYRAKTVAVHDGDTITVDIDLGFHAHFVTDVRLLGCNAIELNQPGGVEARINLRQILLGGPVVAELQLHTVKVDKYGGRYDAQILLPDGTDLVAKLIADGWAAPWDGNGPKPVPAWPRPQAATVTT